MKLKDIGDLANLIAGVGVILSLLFVGYEIRQNTEEARAASAAAVGDNFRELVLARAQSASLAAAVKAGRRGEDVTPVQRSQYTAYVLALTRTVEDAFIQFQVGRLDEDQLQVRLAALRFDFGGADGVQRREGFRRQGVFSEAFMDWLDEELPFDE